MHWVQFEISGGVPLRGAHQGHGPPSWNHDPPPENKRPGPLSGLPLLLLLGYSLYEKFVLGAFRTKFRIAFIVIQRGHQPQPPFLEG